MAPAIFVYATWAAVGSLLHSLLMWVATLLAYAYSAYWHARGRYGFPLQRRGIQANRALVRGKAGPVYFGALLGAGFITEMSTPLVWAGALYAATSGITAAGGYGIGFGLGRSAPALAGIVLGPSITDYGSLAVRIVIDVRNRLRIVGVIGSLLGAWLTVHSIP